MIDETRRAEGIQIDNLSGRQILALEMNGLPGIDISAPNPDVVFEFDSSEKRYIIMG